MSGSDNTVRGLTPSANTWSVPEAFVAASSLLALGDRDIAAEQREVNDVISRLKVTFDRLVDRLGEVTGNQDVAEEERETARKERDELAMRLRIANHLIRQWQELAREAEAESAERDRRVMELGEEVAQAQRRTAEVESEATDAASRFLQEIQTLQEEVAQLRRLRTGTTAPEDAGDDESSSDSGSDSQGDADYEPPTSGCRKR